MFETLETAPERAPEELIERATFGGAEFASPLMVPDYEAGETDAVPEPESLDPVKDALQDAMERTIASLQFALDQKEQALLKSTIAATGLAQQLEQTRTHTENLKKKLTTVVKAHESLNQKFAAIAQTASAPGYIAEAEVVQMKEQWRVAQKVMEREHSRMRSELARAKAGWHQTSQELETQTRARRSEAAHASLQIANLEREVSTARDATAATTGSGEGRMWIRLSATAAGTAIFMLALGLWWQFGRDGSGQTGAGLDGSGQKPVAVVASARPSTQPIATRTATNVGSFGASDSPFQRGEFQKALGRLNNSLYGPIGVTPEQVLRAVRERNAKIDPSVCNFQWNNGQPALYFGGKTESGNNSLEGVLDRCATAVDNYLRPSGTKAGSQPALALKE